MSFHYNNVYRVQLHLNTTNYTLFKDDIPTILSANRNIEENLGSVHCSTKSLNEQQSHESIWHLLDRKQDVFQSHPQRIRGENATQG